MKDFHFSNETTRRHIGASAKILERPRLWIPPGTYPGYTDWIEKAIADLEAERKHGMLGWWGSDEVGGIFYQRHPTDPSILEIRNISVEPSARGRHVADFLFRQVEMEAQNEFPGVTRLVVDTKRSNTGVIGFLENSGCCIVGAQILQGNFGHNGEEDVMLTKKLPLAA